MRKFFLVCLITVFTGCMNLCTRCPGTSGRIKDTYQCTKEMADWTLIVAFPQVLAIEGDRGFSWYNLLTIPLSAIVFVDDCCEAVCDTICYPFDNTRKPEKKEKK